MQIIESTENDFDAIWPIFHEIVSAGDTYAYPEDTTKERALSIWLETPRKTYIAKENNSILGTYYIKTNQEGPGRHVCNCGYMVSSKARGRGLATSMCEHSQEVAKERFFDVSSGFEYGTGRAADHVDHGYKGLDIAVSTGPCPCCLEQAVESFQAGVGIGRGPAPHDSFGMSRQRR